MKIYMVGGAVRDALLGLPVQDHDWVVVGATPQQLIDRGYKPVGRDFPVFLHPATHEEYALARTERKTAPGYYGFTIHAAPDVMLEEDLARRDLTINSIAYYLSDTGANASKLDPSRLIDPFGGQRDLQARVLRHVTDAFREDPVRILRVARFAARFADFSVAPETRQLMREMVAQGEADHLVAERVWQELSRGLMAHMPSRMFEVLRECGALERLLPEIKWGADSNLILDLSATADASLPVRFACVMQSLIDANRLVDLCQRLRVPTECRELADVVAREQGNIHRSLDFNAPAMVQLLERCDAFRKPARFADVLLACEYHARGRLGQEASAYPQRLRLLAALRAAQAVATNSVATQAISTGATGLKIGEMIHAARVAAVASHLAPPLSA